MASPSRLCRLCSGRSDGVKIFTDSTYADVALDEKIYFTVDIKVHKTDVKHTLCTICRDKVLELFEFKKMCKSTESLEKSKKEFPIPNVKIKVEPGEPVPETLPVIGSPVFPGTVTPSLAPTFTPSMSSFGPLPNGAAAMMTIMIDQAGNYVHMPMVPVGPAVPLPMLKTLQLNKENEIDVKIKSDLTSEIDLKKVKLEKKEENHETHNDNSGAPESLKDDKTDNVPDDEKEETVDEIISQISTDKEDEIETSNTKGPKVLRKTRSNSVSSESSTEHTPVRSTPGRARRGRKRRGSFLPQRSDKRRRSGRIGESTRTPDDDNKQGFEKRLTRSSNGVQPRRKIVDSDSGDGDFDPDDPDDPEFSLNKKNETSSSSSAGSDNDDEKKKAESKKEQLLQHLQTTRAEKEEATKKSCPHCQITYKHWVSYDSHVESCERDKLEKEKLEREKPKIVEKEDDKKPIKCIICLEMFTGSKALREHMSVHQTKRGAPYECKACQETFTDKGGLICHNALKHRSNAKEPIVTPDRRRLHCEPCNQSFQNSGDYICHQVLHHKKK